MCAQGVKRLDRQSSDLHIPQIIIQWSGPKRLEMRECGTGFLERSEVPVCQLSSYQLNMHCIQTHGTYHLQCNNEAY